jgi:acyl carrier protein
MDYKSMVREFIVSECLDEHAENDLTDDAPLFRSGILNSMNLVRLVNFIETKVDVTVPAHELTEENFGSINSIAEFIEARKSG